LFSSSPETIFDAAAPVYEASSAYEDELLPQWLDFTLAISNVSSSFQLCYNNVDYNIYRGYHFFLKYEDFGTYGINLIPNMLSYVFVF